MEKKLTGTQVHAAVNECCDMHGIGRDFPSTWLDTNMNFNELAEAINKRLLADAGGEPPVSPLSEEQRLYQQATIRLDEAEKWFIKLWGVIPWRTIYANPNSYDKNAVKDAGLLAELDYLRSQYAALGAVEGQGERSDVFYLIGQKIATAFWGTVESLQGFKDEFRMAGESALEEFWFRATGKHADIDEKLGRKNKATCSAQPAPEGASQQGVSDLDYELKPGEWEDIINREPAAAPAESEDEIRVCKKHRVYFHADCDVCRLQAIAAKLETGHE